MPPMRWFIPELVVVVLCTQALCEPPTNLVEVSTEIGSVAGTLGKITVHAKGSVSKERVKVAVKCVSSEILLGDLELDDSELAGLETALKEILANSDKNYSKKVGTVTIACKEEKEKRVVAISGGSRFRTARWSLDMENAERFATLLKKTQGVHAWMKEKLPTLQK